MAELLTPKGYKSARDPLETQIAIKQVKDFFQQDLASSEANSYILNTNTHKFHFPFCKNVKDIKAKKKKYMAAGRSVLNRDMNRVGTASHKNKV